MDTTHLSSIVSSFHGDTLYNLRQDLLGVPHTGKKKKGQGRSKKTTQQIDTKKPIHLEEFVTAVARRLQDNKRGPGSSSLLSSRIKDLCQLFDLIDIDHDRTIHWDEFTNFIVALGPSNDSTEQRNDQLPSSITYTQRTDFADNVTRSLQVNSLLYMEHLNALFVVESGRSSIKMYGNGCKQIDEIQIGEILTGQLKKEAKWQKEKSQYEKGSSSLSLELSGFEGLEVLAVGTLGPRRRCVVVSTSDSKHVSFISVWDVEKHKMLWKHLTPVSLTGFEFSEPLDMIVSWSSAKDDLHLYIWDIRTRSLKFKLAAVDWQSRGHTGNICCACSVNAHKVLLTGGMGGCIVLWDITISTAQMEPVITGILKGHKHGVRSLAYSEQHDLLLSAGFDIDCLAWDLGFKTLQMRLTGHRAGLVGVAIVKHETERAVTGDMEGVFRLWSIDRANGGRGSCLQTFSVQNSSGIGIRPTGFTPAWDDGKEFIISGSKLFLFQTVRSSHIDAPIMYAGFSSYTGNFCVQRGADIVFVDGKNGNIIKTYSDMIGRNVTAFLADERQKKLVVGNSKGIIGLHNSWNISQLLAAPSHKNDVSCLHFCEEDTLLITAGLDGTLNIHEGLVHTGGMARLGAVPRLTLVRTCRRAHDRGIHLLAFSRPLGLLATASPAEPTVRLWDYQRLALDTICLDESRGMEATTLCFLDPHPLLAVGDHEGSIFIWATRPLQQNGTCLFMFKNMFQPRATLNVGGAAALMPFPTTVTAMTFQSLPDGSKILYTGDDRGYVNARDIQGIVEQFAPQEVDHPKDCGAAYNPRQRHDRRSPLDGISGQKAALLARAMNCNSQEALDVSKLSLKEAEEKEKDTEGSPHSIHNHHGAKFFAPAQLAAKATHVRDASLRPAHAPAANSRDPVTIGGLPGVDPSLMTGSTRSSLKSRQSVYKVGSVQSRYRWQAHTDAISNVKMVYEPESLMTTSLDMTVKVWSIDGKLLGLVYCANENLPLGNIKWKFNFKKSHSEQELDDSKGKVIRSQSRKNFRDVADSNFQGISEEIYQQVHKHQNGSRLPSQRIRTDSMTSDEDINSPEVQQRLRRTMALGQARTSQQQHRDNTVEASPPITPRALAQALLEDLDMGQQSSASVMHAAEVTKKRETTKHLKSWQSKVRYTNFHSEQTRGLRNARLMDHYETQLERLGVTGKGAEVRKKWALEQKKRRQLGKLRPMTAPASIDTEGNIEEPRSRKTSTLVDSFEDLEGFADLPELNPIMLSTEPAIAGTLTGRGVLPRSGRKSTLKCSASAPQIRKAASQQENSEDNNQGQISAPPIGRRLSLVERENLFQRKHSQYEYVNAHNEKKKERLIKMNSLLNTIELASKEPITSQHNLATHRSPTDSYTQPVSPITQRQRAETPMPTEEERQERLQSILKRYQSVISQDESRDFMDMSSASRMSTLRRKKTHSLMSTKNKKNKPKGHKKLAKEPKDLSLLLQQDVEHQEDQLGLTKQGTHGRYGPYSSKDILEFKDFFDRFAKEGSNIINLENNPAFLQNPDAEEILSSFKGRSIAKGKSELTMDEFMEITFCFAKYEERRRMVHLIDFLNLGARIRDEMWKKPHKEKRRPHTEVGKKSTPDDKKRSMTDDEDFFSKELLHEIELHFRTCEREDCGTVTVREMYEVLAHHKVIELSYKKFEDIAKQQVVYLNNKRVLGNKEWELFWDKVSKQDIQQIGLSFSDAMMLLKKLKKEILREDEAKSKKSRRVSTRAAVGNKRGQSPTGSLK